MLAVDGAIETLVQQKTRRRALLAQLHALALFEFLQLVGGKTRLEQDIRRHAEPIVEVVAQPRRAQHRVRRTERRAGAERRAEAVDLFGDLDAAFGLVPSRSMCAVALAKPAMPAVQTARRRRRYAAAR